MISKATFLLFLILALIAQSTSDGNVFPSQDTCGHQTIDADLTVGKAAILGEFPWLASIKYTSKKSGNDVGYKCVGSVINSRYILTTAACISNDVYQVSEVRLGEYNTLTDPDCVNDECMDSVKDFGVEEIVPHPEFSSTRKDNDIGLIRLDKEVNFTESIRPVCLSHADGIKSGDNVVSTGWGLTLQHEPSTIMKKVISLIIPLEECSEFFKNVTNITENQFCSRPLKNNNDAMCAGDAGAPVMVLHGKQWFQEGISSMGNNCWRSDATDVNTRITSFQKWIKDTVKP